VTGHGKAERRHWFATGTVNMSGSGSTLIQSGASTLTISTYACPNGRADEDPLMCEIYQPKDLFQSEFVESS
jgi:hypothetical protein